MRLAFRSITGCTAIQSCPCSAPAKGLIASRLAPIRVAESSSANAAVAGQRTSTSRGTARDVRMGTLQSGLFPQRIKSGGGPCRESRARSRTSNACTTRLRTGRPRGLVCVAACAAPSELLAPGPDVELQRPGGAVLAMKRVVGLRDRVGIEHAAFGQVRGQIREPFVDSGHVDDAVDDDVAHMDAARSERARHRLRNGPQAGLGGRERGEFGVPPEPQGAPPVRTCARPPCRDRRRRLRRVRAAEGSRRHLPRGQVRLRLRRRCRDVRAIQPSLSASRGSGFSSMGRWTKPANTPKNMPAHHIRSYEPVRS